MGESSIWAVLPPGTPPAVAQSFTFGTPPVLTLWPPQRELLASARLNPLSPSSERLFISVPTSAGKTLLAQLIVCSHLANASGSVCYVTPLRSLGREMRQAMRTRLAILNRKLASDLPDAANETWLAALGVDAEPPAVDIMTPERLMNAIRRDPASTLSRYSLFIVDEALLIAQSSRGFLLEGLLTFLDAAGGRLVLLSGVMGNAASLASWASHGAGEILYTSDWRGPRRLRGILNSDADWSASTLVSVRGRSDPDRHVPVRAHLRIKPAASATVSLTTGIVGGFVLRDGKRRGGDPAYKIAAMGAAALLHAGTLLMVVNRRDYAKSAAEVIAAEFDPGRRTPAIFDSCSKPGWVAVIP